MMHGSEAGPPPPNSHLPESRNMAKVLLVEDSPTQAVEMRMLLEEGCHDVRHAANGRLALEVLSEESLDIVVTDLEMPEVNGLELVETMRTDYAHIPAILVTARGSEELAAEALQKGAAGYVPRTTCNRCSTTRSLTYWV